MYLRGLGDLEDVFIQLYFWFKYDLDRGTMHPQFDQTGLRTYDLQIMNIAFHVPVMSLPLGQQGPQSEIDHNGNLNHRISPTWKSDTLLLIVELTKTSGENLPRAIHHECHLSTIL